MTPSSRPILFFGSIAWLALGCSGRLLDPPGSALEDSGGETTKPDSGRTVGEADATNQPPPPTTDDASSGADASRDDGSTDVGGPAIGDASFPVDAPMIPGCTLLWSPSAMRDGKSAFEFDEMPDHSGPPPSHPPPAVHLSFLPEHDAFRIDSHFDLPNAIDWDRAEFTGAQRNDRLRCEVRGMLPVGGAPSPSTDAPPSGELDMVNGQTWRISWSLYIPSTLKGTGRFSHIMQLKFIDTGGGVSGSPVITMTLIQPDAVELHLWLGAPSAFPTVDLSALHDKWLSTALTINVAPKGSVHWTFSDGTKALVDQQIMGVTTWPANAARVRPKWGIYRGTTTGVQTTYIMFSDYLAYKCQ